MLVPDAVEVKLRNRRGLTGQQIRAACEWPARPERAVWDVSPVHGRRLVLIVKDEQRRLLRVVLQPIDEDEGTWRLRTAFVARRESAP